MNAKVIIVTRCDGCKLQDLIEVGVEKAFYLDSIKECSCGAVRYVHYIKASDDLLDVVAVSTKVDKLGEGLVLLAEMTLRLFTFSDCGIREIYNQDAKMKQIKTLLAPDEDAKTETHLRGGKHETDRRRT